MSILEITYPEKSNSPGDTLEKRQFRATDANEVKNVAKNHAAHLRTIFARLGIESQTPSIGEFLSLPVLQAAYPDGANGSYAIIDDGLGSTPQVATYNDVNSLWELATPDSSIIWISNLAARPNNGLENKLYIFKETGAIQYYDQGEWKDATASSEIEVKSFYMDINSPNGSVGQKFMGIKENVNDGSWCAGTAVRWPIESNADVNFEVQF